VNKTVYRGGGHGVAAGSSGGDGGTHAPRAIPDTWAVETVESGIKQCIHQTGRKLKVRGLTLQIVARVNFRFESSASLYINKAV